MYKFESLPAEIIGVIVSNLHWKHVFVLRRVNRSLNHFISQNIDEWISDMVSPFMISPDEPVFKKWGKMKLCSRLQEFYFKLSSFLQDTKLLRTVLLGDCKVGKTSFVTPFMPQTDNLKIKEMYEKQIHFFSFTHGEVDWKINILDSKAEPPHEVASCIRVVVNNHITIFVYDITDIENACYSDRFVEIKKKALGSELDFGTGATIILLTKTDSVPQKMLPHLIEEWKQFFATHEDLQWYEIIPVSNRNLTEAGFEYIMSHGIINALCRDYILNGDRLFNKISAKRKSVINKEVPKLTSSKCNIV